VQVLDGGLPAALAAGLVSDALPPEIEPGPPYPASGWHWPLADIDAVARRARDPQWCVLDVRAAARYRGDTEPIDPVAGHIPGAVNLPYTDNLRDGCFVASDELRARYARLLDGRAPQRLIVHCGSGITACHTLLALEHAGLPGASLYVGSWSEWCRSARPQARGGAA
jgi:thiosulfate/3-mercaptopyruvate sulfurtransferase